MTGIGKGENEIGKGHNNQGNWCEQQRWTIQSAMRDATSDRKELKTLKVQQE